MTQTEQHLHTYLQDHLAGSTGGIELAKRCLRNNHGSELGRFLSAFIVELDKEQRQLKKLMDTLKIPPWTWKQAVSWILEKAGRLKLNDRLFQYSDLSRLIELEALLSAVNAKLDMWKILESLADGEARMATIPLARLHRQAEEQIQQLSRECLKAGRKAFRG